MGEMKKNVLLVLVSIVVASFTGCAGSQEAEIPSRENLSTEIVEDFEFPS